jgi:hypothetical protein
MIIVVEAKALATERLLVLIREREPASQQHREARAVQRAAGAHAGQP